MLRISYSCNHLFDKQCESYLHEIYGLGKIYVAHFKKKMIDRLENQAETERSPSQESLAKLPDFSAQCSECRTT